MQNQNITVVEMCSVRCLSPATPKQSFVFQHIAMETRDAVVRSGNPSNPRLTQRLTIAIRFARCTDSRVTLGITS